MQAAQAGRQARIREKCSFRFVAKVVGRVFSPPRHDLRRVHGAIQFHPICRYDTADLARFSLPGENSTASFNSREWIHCCQFQHPLSRHSPDRLRHSIIIVSACVKSELFARWKKVAAIRSSQVNFHNWCLPRFSDCPLSDDGVTAADSLSSQCWLGVRLGWMRTMSVRRSVGRSVGARSRF